jgi:selenocysteine-specific elongation factor
MHIVVGTAGHIDHGKTALVKALTGIDTDRLPEEKKRGITIDLGFAEMNEPDAQIGFVDVPGHERFIKNMLAGASGIDLVMLVVAADEGVMPQTQEHFDICRLLQIRSGVIVLTKTDLVDETTFELARLEVAELVKDSFLELAPVFETSVRTGAGIEELKGYLVNQARNATARQDDLEPLLPVDRSFAVKGFGAVATGTLAFGTIREGDELELLPDGKKVRVRGIQTHGRTVREASAGQRTAVNLGSIDYEHVRRGMVLSRPGVLKPAQIFDAEIEVLGDAARPLRSRQRLRVNIGTAEVLARVAVVGEHQEIQPGTKGFAQLRLESPLAAVSGERFIIRTYSPQITIGGGAILRPAAEKLRRKDAIEYKINLRDIYDALGDKEQMFRLLVRSAGASGITAAEMRSLTGWSVPASESAVGTAVKDGVVVNAGGVFIDWSAFDSLKSQTLAEAEEHHKKEPLSRGLPLEAIRGRVFKYRRPELQKAVLTELEREGELIVERDIVKRRSHSLRLSPAEQAVFNKLKSIYETAGLEVPKLDDALSEVALTTGTDCSAVRRVFQLFLNSGEIVGISDEFYFSSAGINALKEKLRRFAETAAGRAIDVAAFKDLAGISRKYAIPLLEYFDRERVTARSGDTRIIM